MLCLKLSHPYRLFTNGNLMMKKCGTKHRRYIVLLGTEGTLIKTSIPTDNVYMTEQEESPKVNPKGSSVKQIAYTLQNKINIVKRQKGKSTYSSVLNFLIISCRENVLLLSVLCRLQCHDLQKTCRERALLKYKCGKMLTESMWMLFLCSWQHSSRFPNRFN